MKIQLRRKLIIAFFLTLTLGTSGKLEAALMALISGGSGELQAAAGKVSVGDKVPNFSLRDLKTGKIINLKDIEARILVIDFWASWCGPCITSMPDYEAKYNEYKNKGVAIIGVNQDANLQDAKDFLKKRGEITFMLVWDEGNKYAEFFNLPTMPTRVTAVREEDGSYTIVEIHGGYRSGDKEKFTKLIEELLKAGLLKEEER